MADNTTSRCPAAHPDDPTPCDGPPAVTVIDDHGSSVDGCEHHAARLLASLGGGRVHPLPGGFGGAVIRVYTAADGIRPFPWLTDAPRTRPEQLSHRENREAAISVPSLPTARETAREMYDRYISIDVHDRRALVEAYTALTITLGRLLDALDGEEGSS